MAANNSIHLMGNLGRDVELRYTPKGTAKATFTLAVSRFGGEEKKTDWFDVTIFGKSAEAAAQHLKKGTKVVVEGRMETYEYEKDGQKRKGYTVTAHDWTFAESKRSGGEEMVETEGTPSDDLPF